MFDLALRRAVPDRAPACLLAAGVVSDEVVAPVRPPGPIDLIPVALGLALLVGFVLGPSGRPQPAGNGAGGLSGVLDRRRGGVGAAI